MDEQTSTDALLTMVVDYVMPVLPPYETSIYLYLLRRSHLDGSPTVRVGKRTIGEGLGKGTRSTRGNYQHISEKLENLERAGFIAVGDADRRGTLYTVRLPAEVSSVRERMIGASGEERRGDYYRDPELRVHLFERDSWLCRYCGESLTKEEATLDHIVPVARDGGDEPDNLATCCLMCNSIKSGRTYEEAAPQLLATVRARRMRTCG